MTDPEGEQSHTQPTTARGQGHHVPAAPRGEPPLAQRIDALLPAEMAAMAEKKGAEKTRMDALSLFALAVLAGAFIALGIWFATTLTVGEGLAYGPRQLLGAFGFALSFVLVVVGGAELFTSNNLMVMAWASRRVRLLELLRAWVIVYAGNLVGAAATAAMVLLAGEAAVAGGQIAQKIGAAAVEKADLSFVAALFRAILGNVLVCLASWVSYSARTTTDRVIVVMLPIMAFYAMGLEHVIAVMTYFPFALALQALAGSELGSLLAITPPAGSGVTLGDFLGHLVPVTLGNIIGGGVLVGAVYWFIYLRPVRP